MTDKELFKIDLYQRLPYDCKVSIAIGGIDGLQWNDETLNSYLMYEIENEDAWDYIKPYLRPLSSMTEEEKSQYNFYLTRIVFAYDASLLIDWLNKNMFDYRGLIPKGYAISTEEFNPYKD